MSARARLYVVTAPEDRRGVYETWEACRAAVHGTAGARYQAVGSREEAEAMLRGEGVTLPPGLHAFVDGNHEGGVGVVVVDKRADGTTAVIQDAATSVEAIFGPAGLAGLETPAAIRATLARIRNVLAELGGLHAALALLPEGARATVVHDYEGVGAWMTGRWRTKDPAVTAVVDACRSLVEARRLRVTYRQQPSHRSTFAGVNELVAFNRRADALAAEGARLRG